MAMMRWKHTRIDSRPEWMLPAPYFEWARATDYAYYGQTEWLPVLIELKPDGPLHNAQLFAREVFRRQAGDKPGWAADLRVPRHFAQRPARMVGDLRFLTALVRKKFLVSLYAGDSPADSIRRFELGRANPLWTGERVGEDDYDSAASFDCNTAAVVIGVIDDGMAFAHDRFLSSDNSTRIEYLLDQHLALLPGFGIETSKPGIDALLAGSQHGSLVDEDELYRRSGHVDHSRPGHKPLAACMAHGTHVMDLACNPPGPQLASVPPAPDTRPIIAVQLPAAAVQDTSGAMLGPHIFFGLFYILLRAHTLAQRRNSPPLPLVVNVSYGVFAGPHDGSSLFEAALDALIDICNPPGSKAFHVVLPAGNGHLSRCHAQFALPRKATQKLRWRVLPDDWTESWVEVWLPPGVDVQTLGFAITAPDGALSTGSFFGGSAWDIEVDGHLVGKACYYPPLTAAERTLVRFAIAPTGSPSGAGRLAPAGVWLIEVMNNQGGPAVADIHAWVQRDDTAPGFKRRGRQSFFDDADYRRYNDGGRAIDEDPAPPGSPVRRDGTLNAMASGKRPVVIAGFRRSSRTSASYSAGGPLLHLAGGGPGDPDGPDAMLPSDDSPSHPGVLGAGTRSGACFAMNGTSVAAPLATQLIVERLASNKSSHRQAIFAAALAGDPAQPGKPLSKRGGGGRIANGSTRRPRYDW
jgi:hypothetical protein